MTRSLLLFLAGNRTLRRWMESWPLSRRLTRRFIPGASFDEVLDVSLRLHREGMLVTADRLGENVTTPAEAAVACEASIQALERLAALHIGATFSIKLTQFGLDLSTEECLAHARRLAARAQALGTRIEIDMEANGYTDRTLAIVGALHVEFGAVRAVIQAYLRRTAGDIASLCEQGIPVRLCKGAYDEPPSVALRTKAEVDANYIAQTKILLDRGVYPAIATHDPRMIDAALAHVAARGISQEQFEFQMLYGIRRDLQQRLVAQGYRLRLYVPYGEAWYPYFMRRLAERPANVIFLLRNLFRR